MAHSIEFRQAAVDDLRTVYDCIGRLVGELEDDDAAWTNFFAFRRIEPLHLIYETMVADPKHALANVLSALGRDPTIAVSIRA